MNTALLVHICYRDYEAYQAALSDRRRKQRDQTIARWGSGSVPPEHLKMWDDLIMNETPTWRFNEVIGFLEVAVSSRHVYGNVWLDRHMFPYPGTATNWKRGRYSSSRKPRYEQYWPMHFHLAKNHTRRGRTFTEEIESCVCSTIDELKQADVFGSRRQKVWIDVEGARRLIRAIDWEALLAAESLAELKDGT